MCADINEDDEQKGYTWEIAYAEGISMEFLINIIFYLLKESCLRCLIDIAR